MVNRDPRAPKTARRASASPWRPTRERRRERELKREAVILTAARAFEERGFHNTALDDIAALLNVTKPTIYHYVDNKEKLLFECFRTGLDRLRAAFDAAGQHEASGLERLRTVVRGYAEAIASEFGWCMVSAEEQDLSPAMSRRIKALKSEIDQGLRQILSAGMRDGSIRACDPKMTAFALAGALNWIAHWHRAGESLTPVEIADRFLDVFLEGLRPR